MTDCDVAIVGCGPVGLVLANLLGAAGRSVVVLERHPERYALPRAVHFDHEVGRILQACGLGPDLPALTEAAPVYEWRAADGRVLLRFGGRHDGVSGWPNINMCWQPGLEARLEEVTGAQPTVDIRRGVTVTGLADHGDAVTLSFDRAGGGGTLTAAYVIGCDGANSTVRDLLGIPVTDLGFFYDWLIVDVHPHEPRVYDPVNLQVCDPARPTTAVSGGPGRRRWEFMALPGESTDELNTAATAWALLAPWDVHPGNADLERHTVYRFHARWADTWRVGRVLIAGDAAHLMPPFAGQGMCSGIRDAANLAWKLDAVLGGHASDAILDTYAVEREQNVQAVINFSMELGKVICISDPAEAAARDELMAGGVAADEVSEVPPLPGIPTGIVVPDDPLAGTLFVQGRVGGDALAAARFDDVHGAGWRLVTPTPSALDPEQAQWFAGLGGTVVDLASTGDPDGTYTDWFARHRVTVALQRPDFYLYGAGDDPTALVSHLRVALEGTS